MAIKILSDSYAEAPEWRERMFREAQAMVVLAGTHAVRVFDQQWSDEGHLCLVMELLDGVDYEDYLRDRESRGEKIGIAELARIMDPVVQNSGGRAQRRDLASRHQAGNLFVLRNGSVRLLDFGFAEVRPHAEPHHGGLRRRVAELHRARSVERRPRAARPPHRRVRARGGDFRSLTGKPPFLAGELLDLVKLATTGARPSLHALRPDLPPDVDAWVEQSLAIDPDHRFVRVRAMWAALRHFG